MRKLVPLLCICLALGTVGAPLGAQTPSILPDHARFKPVRAAHGMVSSQEARATRIGVDILKQGGNAVDAAVAVGFALAVTLPRAGNLGGGGFMIIHRADKGETHALDYRETAPAASTAEMLLNEAGEYDRDKATASHLSVAVPGTVAGLAMALEKFGTMSLRDVIQPAIVLARDGFIVDQAFRDSFTEQRVGKLRRWTESWRVFLRDDGAPHDIGARFRQPDLAATLERIAERGPAGFYDGDVAARVAADMEANGGLVTRADLKAYRPVLRVPVRGSYRGHDVVSMPPPSSGGVHLIQMLNVLEGFDIRSMGPNSAATIHAMAEAMKFAYADRSWYLGDPGYWKVPVAGLVSKAYADEIRRRIDPKKARTAGEIGPGDPKVHEGRNTTHFSVVDAAGNVVSNTYTLNLAYGSGIVAKGTGVLLNNEMDDFAAKPGVPNSFGLIGGAANAIEPGKRPLSSMTPTIVFRDGKPLLITGSPGGSRIITTVLQMVLNVVDHRLNVAAATAAPRIHHQWRPDRLYVEQGLSPDTLGLLAALGHDIHQGFPFGGTQSIMMAPQGLTGFSDPRRAGGLTLGY